MAEKLYTEAELKKLTLADLREIAEDNGFDTDNKHKKSDLVTYILENQGADDEIEDDEIDDDEVDDTEESDDEVDDEDEELDDEDEVDDEVDDEELEEEEPEPAPKPKAKKAKKKVDTHDGEETLAAKQVAALLNTDAKTLRQFFRSPASTTEAVGSGGRYEFLESQIDQIRNEFASWAETKATRTRTKTEGGSTSRKKKERVIAEDDIAPEIEDLEDELDELEDDIELDDDEIEED